MPRSGTNWLSQIFASSPDVRLKFCPLFSYEFKNKLDETSTAEDWKIFFRDVFHRKSEYLDQNYLRNKGLIPKFTHNNCSPSHLVIKTTRFHNLIPSILDLHKAVLFIHIIRDPRAVIHSWLTNPFEFPSDADPLTEWRSGACRTNGQGEFWGFDAWKSVNMQAIEMQKHYPKRFSVWSYENLTEDTAKIVGKMFAFCGLKVGHRTYEFLKESQSRHISNKKSVYKKSANLRSWKGKLNTHIAESCREEITDTPLAKFLH
jgi:hypothetical protein